MKEFSEDTYEKIEAYLLKRLDSDATQRFEAEMNQNIALKEEVVKMELLRKIVNKIETRRNIREIQAKVLNENEAQVADNEFSLKPKRKTISFSKLVSFSAAAMVLFMVGFNFLAFDLPDKETLAMRGIALQDQKQKDQERYFEAQLLLIEGENEEAAVIFEDISKTKDIDPYYFEACEWYRAVALIETEPETSQKIIEKLSKNPHPKFKISYLERAKAWVKIQKTRLFGVKK
jgi:hypothetical protein